MITDTEARKIASSWHGGGGTALYAFVSTGAILDDAFARSGILTEIDFDILMDDEQPITEADATDLDNLRTYCQKHGPRGPQPGWNDLTW